MSKKRCEECRTEYQDQDGRHFGHCPKCDSTYFTLVSLREVPTSSTQTSVPKVPVVPPKSQYEIEEEQRLFYEASIDPELLVRFKRRFQLELEEMTYLEWRAMQPQWKFQVAKTGSEPRVESETGGLSGTQIRSTAAGVFLGTAAIRAQLDDINNEEDSESSDSSGDDEGGIAGFLDGLFN